MSKRIKIQKKPTTSEAIMVTKKEIEEYKKQYPSISMGNHDVEYLRQFDEEDVVGVITGELNKMDQENPDIWFVNIDYFNKNYTII